MSKNEEQTAVWVQCFNICTQIAIASNGIYYPQHTDDIDGQSEFEQQSEERIHKEEAAKRKEFDRKGRIKLLEQVRKYFHPITELSEKLLNIVNGKVAPENVNTHKALEIGIAQMREFQEKLPAGLQDVIERRVKFM